MRRLILLLTAVAVLTVPGAFAKATSAIALPNAFPQPEGIAVGTGSTFYVGSILTGAIYAGDLRTGRGDHRRHPRPDRPQGDRPRIPSRSPLVSGAGNGMYVYDVGKPFPRP